MMRPCGEDLKIYLYRQPVDMRRGRNGLAALAQEAMRVDPFSGALLVDVGRRFNAVKILYWHLNGFALWHKRIESKERFHWPRLLQEDVVTLSVEQINWLLDGYDIWTQPHQMLRLQHAS
jgi:transposase